MITCSTANEKYAHASVGYHLMPTSLHACLFQLLATVTCSQSQPPRTGLCFRRAHPCPSTALLRCGPVRTPGVLSFRQDRQCGKRCCQRCQVTCSVRDQHSTGRWQWLYCNQPKLHPSFPAWTWHCLCFHRHGPQCLLSSWHPLLRTSQLALSTVSPRPDQFIPRCIDRGALCAMHFLATVHSHGDGSSCFRGWLLCREEVDLHDRGTHLHVFCIESQLQLARCIPQPFVCWIVLGLVWSQV